MLGNIRNFKFEYLYRDAENYKIFGSLYLRNNVMISLNDAKSQITEKLIDGEYFYPQGLGMKLFPEHSNSFTGWYEFDRILESDKNKNTDLDFEIFVKQLNRT